jgi:hypothetical protein
MGRPERQTDVQASHARTSISLSLSSRPPSRPREKFSRAAQLRPNAKAKARSGLSAAFLPLPRLLGKRSHKTDPCVALRSSIFIVNGPSSRLWQECESVHSPLIPCILAPSLSSLSRQRSTSDTSQSPSTSTAGYAAPLVRPKSMHRFG